MTRAEQAIEQMQSTFEEIEHKVESLPADWLPWRPARDVWSILDNLCHIEEFIPYWSGQIAQVISHPELEWGRTHHDPARLAAVEDTSKRDLAELLISIRRRMTSLREELFSYDDGILETAAPSRNPRWGSKPASFILDELLVIHLRKHSEQIQKSINQLRKLEAQQER